MKKVLLGLLLGNIVHFASREAGSLLKAYRDRECRHVKVSTDECREATMIEKALLFELDLGSKLIDP